MRTRMRTWSIPLPAGVCGGGAVRLEDGTYATLTLNHWASGWIDKRRLKRLQRRARLAARREALQAATPVPR